MKILWLCNIPLPDISRSLDQTPFVGGGWLDLLSKQISDNENNELAVCFPLRRPKGTLSGECGNIKFFVVPKTVRNDFFYDKKMEKIYTETLRSFKPDIIHIWGTEFPRTLAMVNACNKLNMIEKVVIDIQGLCSFIYRYGSASLPKRIVLMSILGYALRAKFEIKSIKSTNNLIGRTDWDEACVSVINNNTRYFFCSRILREKFYSASWDINNCHRHSIFVSQGSNPIKGLHYVIQAMPFILRDYPDTCLYVAGSDITKRREGMMGKIRLSGYSKYIKELIIKYSLQNKIKFLGELNENDMCGRYLKSHVFVSASSIENSPNSVGEAMILGVPTVSSFVGGVPSMLEHNKEGFLYQYDAPYMLAYHVKRIFEDDNLAFELSENAKKRASITHNKETNYERIMEIYRSILT